MQQRKFCKYCHQPITEEMLEQRRLKKIQNAHNSRAKAIANGTPPGRKIKAPRALVRELYGMYPNVKEVAKKLDCSPAAVYRALNRSANG